MLISLGLKNFKKHTDRSINFSAGLNVFRAPNEEGKSSIYDAIRYALWGARALPDSLEDTVTWGQPVSSLKVFLVFSVAEVIYRITRSKSGAELTAPGLVVSGHSEVTAYVEKLTGASAYVGLMTLIAPQGGLQDSLKSSAVELIEKLSNVELIDKLITSVQSNLPCGNTKLIEQQLLPLQDLSSPVADFSAEVAEIQHASISIEQLKVTLGTARLKLSEAGPAADSAKDRIFLERERKKLISACELRLQRAQRDVQWPIDDYIGPSVDELEVALSLQKEDAAVRRAWGTFSSIPAYEKVETTTESLTAKLTELRAQLKLLTGSGHAMHVESAALKATLITADTCNQCGKDLKDVAEVVASNARICEKLESYRFQLEELALQIAEVERQEVQVQQQLKADQHVRALLARIEQLVNVSYATVPPTVTWISHDVSNEPDTRNLEEMLKRRRADLEYYNRMVGVAQEADRQVGIISAELAKLRNTEHLLGDEDAAIAAYDCEYLLVSKTERELSGAERTYAGLVADHRLRQELHAKAVEAFKEKCATREMLTAQLASYASNNLLIKKLREVRPIVARELWNLVSSSVSHTFSLIRGVQSTVTRADDKFLIDGKSVSVYSGSTKDSLGLAVRMVSQKIFLPNVNFMLLDEAASGADAVRETAMLSTLTTCGFPQVILVTHSELADTYASNLIVL